MNPKLDNQMCEEKEYPFDKAEADWEEDCRREKEYWEQIDAEQAIWKAKWPNYCKECGGWGAFGTVSIDPQDPGPEPCEELGFPGKCHRCKGELIESNIIKHDDGYYAEWKCKECGWSWDDGIPYATH